MAVNHFFNSAFDVVATFPSSPLADLIGGALVLIRRTLFFIPEGVTADQAGTALTVSVNTGSVAYFRQDGTALQVSGDPWFLGAQRFDAATVSAVSVSNPGNAGSAGLAVTTGTVNGDLTTSGIDSIRFGSGAAFSGHVTSTLTNGTLTLTDAVRGFSGVTLDASVRLANDVEVDAGSGAAIFTGAVDAASTGKQSLIVTALSSTTFNAAVGGQAALAALLTRGIAPINIQQSSDSKTIQLHYLPEYNTNGQPQVKYGIDVAIGDNPSQMYEFDTGGAAFFAGYNRQFWQNVPLTTTGVSEAYSSGNYYDGVVSETPITLGAGSQTVSTGQPIQIAAVLAGGNTNTGAVFDFSNPEVPPVESHFFGDFGASFGTMPVAGQDTPLANPLFQLPGNLSSGFLVQLGPIGTDPQLTVGVTDELRAQFPYAVPVSALVGGGTYPVSGYPVLQSFGFSPSYYAQLGTGPEMPIGTNQNPQCATQCLPSLIDSGAPSTGIRLKDAIGGDPYNDNGQLQTGVNFIARFPTTDGRAPLEWTFVAGDNGSVNLVNYQQGAVANPGQNVNTGLNLYNAFDVMFDVKEQVIWLRPTGGDSTVSLQSVTTTGDQNYQQGATLNGTYAAGGGFSVAGVTTLLGDTVIDAGGGDVRFSGTVDGRHSLTVNSSGTTEFIRNVGAEASLASLTTDAAGSTSSSGVRTTGDQTYNDAATLNGLYTVAYGSFEAIGNSTLAGPVSIEAEAGDITFDGSVDAQSGRGFSLTLTTGPGHHIRFNQDVGSTQPLGGVAVLNPTGAQGNPASISAAGSITLVGNLGFTATQGISVADYVNTTLNGGGQVQSFAGDGISLGASSGSQISGFVVSGNGGDGIAVTKSDNLSLANNAIISNAGDGIRATKAQTMTVTDSSVTGNAHNGIDADQATDLTISSTTVSGNGNDGTGAQFNGVLLTGADHVTITGSTIGGNFKDGILSSDSSTVAIADNVITANGRYGVTVETGTGNSILSNSIFSNGPALGTTGFGISLQNGGNNDQSAPIIGTATFAGGRITVTGTLTLPDRYTGDYQIQVFYTASATQFTVQGQQLLGEAVAHFTDGRTGSFSASFDASPASPGNYVTATATPGAGIPNTSQFSGPLQVRT
ncbi:MAG: right-handed parallel beta-helix repeat-containing protein [Mycobacterium sp.]